MAASSCGFVEEERMGRDASTTLEQAALSFLSAIDPERGIDAALFLRRTGLVLASWTREGIRLDVVSVMAATMLASIDTIVEALGGSTSGSVIVESGDRQIVAAKVGSKAFLVVIARKSVSRTVVRKTVNELVAHLNSLPGAARPPMEGTASNPRVKVRPPR
jgi:predicted regulator of Ras-like GTPase activity (Roadblock/LC7/MglB family)